MFRIISGLAIRFVYLGLAASVAALLVGLALLAPGLALVAVLFLLFARSRRIPYLSSAHGTARWAGYMDLLYAGMLGRQGLILGRANVGDRPTLRQVIYALLFWPVRDSAMSVTLAKVWLGRRPNCVVRLADHSIPHLAAFAASGAGKSTSLVIPNLLRDPACCVVLDPKSELFDKTAETRARVLGHTIIRIDPFNIAGNSRFPAQGFNPLSLIDSKSPLAVDDARRLANAMVIRNPEAKDPFWDNAAQLMVHAALLFLLGKCSPKEATLNTMRDILCSAEVLDQAISVMQNADEYQGMLSRMASQLASFQGNTKSSVMAVLNTHLEFLDSLPVAGTLAASTFDPRELLTGKMTIYLCLPVDRIQELRGLQRILVTALINMIFSAGESRDRRVRFYLDEAATLAEIEPLYSALVFGRSFGIRLFFLFQSISQVELCFPRSKADDFRATVASIYGGTNDFKTAQEISQWIGQATAHTFSSQSGRSWGGNTNNSHHEQSHGTNYGYSDSFTHNEVARAVIRPEEVLQLPLDEAIVLLPHVPPLRVTKMPYYRRFRERRSPISSFGELAILALVFIFVIGGIGAVYDRYLTEQRQNKAGARYDWRDVNEDTWRQ